MSETLTDRFEIVRMLGQGGQARTYLARDLQREQQVAVKELRLARAADWKAIELFERESAILRNLSHPTIPGYVDAFHLDDGRRVCLVQEYIEGSDLESLSKEGELFDEAALRDFMSQMLDILGYLQDFSPPVVHRDIKPSNILRDAGGNYHLVDFGAVQVIVQDDVGGSTIVGTTGFMPPEQLMGRALPASDVYSLAATCVQMVCGMHPGDMPMERMKLQFRDLVGLPESLNDILERMLEPVVSARFRDARAVQEALKNEVIAPAIFGPPPGAPVSAARAKRQPPASRREALEERLHELVGSPPVFLPYSNLSMSGNNLQIQIDLPSAPRILGMILFGPAIASIAIMLASSGGDISFGGIVAAVGSVLCLGLPLFLVGVFLLIFNFKPALGLNSGTYELEMTRAQINLRFYHRPLFREMSKLKEYIEIPIDELQNCYLHNFRREALTAERKGPPKHWFQKQGIYFVDTKGGVHAFNATGLITEGDVISVGFNDERHNELDWLYDIVRTKIELMAEAYDEDLGAQFSQNMQHRVSARVEAPAEFAHGEERDKDGAREELDEAVSVPAEAND